MPSPRRAETNTASGQQVAQPGQGEVARGVGLVDHQQLARHRAALLLADLDEHLPHGLDLVFRQRVRGVDDVHEQVRPGGLLQRRAERLDELVRQVPDEPDGVGQGVARPSGVTARRVVGSRVANSASSTSTPAPVSALSRLDLPALV